MSRHDNEDNGIADDSESGDDQHEEECAIGRAPGFAREDFSEGGMLLFVGGMKVPLDDPGYDIPKPLKLCGTYYKSIDLVVWTSSQGQLPTRFGGRQNGETKMILFPLWTKQPTRGGWLFAIWERSRFLHRRNYNLRRTSAKVAEGALDLQAKEARFAHAREMERLELEKFAVAQAFAFRREEGAKEHDRRMRLVVKVSKETTEPVEQNDDDLRSIISRIKTPTPSQSTSPKTSPTLVPKKTFGRISPVELRKPLQSPTAKTSPPSRTLDSRLGSMEAAMGTTTVNSILPPPPASLLPAPVARPASSVFPNVPPNVFPNVLPNVLMQK